MGYFVINKNGKETKIELQKEKTSDPYIKIGDEYGHLTTRKPDHDTIIINGKYYLSEFAKKLASMRIVRETLYDGDKGHNYPAIIFYNKSNEVICEFRNLGSLETATAPINTELKDQSIAWFYMNWYNDTHSGGYVRITGYVTDVDGEEHIVFQGGSFKNHGNVQECWVGWEQGGDPDGDGTKNWSNWSNRLTINNFPFQLVN